jgi:mannose-6-phosphate isomerase-like protein (cupin superfamily)
MSTQTRQPARAAAPVVVHSDEGEAQWLFDSLVLVRATATDTDGRLTIFETADPPDGRYGPFVSRHYTMIFWVLEGSARFEVGGTDVDVGPGDLVAIPRGVTQSHTTGDEGCHSLLITAPAGLEEMFAVLSRPAARRELPPDAGGPVDRKRLLAIWAGHGIEPLERP